MPEDKARNYGVDQLLTPDQSLPLAELLKHNTDRRQPLVPPVPCTQRGLRLSIAEELCLIQICKENLSHYDTTGRSKSFWVHISDSFAKDSGRAYSWQSCKRRFSNYVQYRKAYLNALGAGVQPPKSVTYVDVHVCNVVDKWIRECDAREKTRNEQLRARTGAFREEREEREKHEHAARRLKNFKQIQDWIDGVEESSVEELLPSSSPGDNSSLTRSRSRSPRRSEDDPPPHSGNRYRQRSPSRHGLIDRSSDRRAGSHIAREGDTEKRHANHIDSVVCRFDQPGMTLAESIKRSRNGRLINVMPSKGNEAAKFEHMGQFFIDTIKEAFTSAAAIVTRRIDELAHELDSRMPLDFAKDAIQSRFDGFSAEMIGRLNGVKRQGEQHH